MATLVIREVPDELNEALARRAQKNRRSKEKEALQILEQSVGTAAVDWNEFFDRPRRKVERDHADEIRRASR